MGSSGSEHPTAQSFWKLSSPESVRGLAEWDRNVRLDSIRCSKDAGHARPGRRLTDLSVRLTSTVVSDFVWTWHSECLIRDHVLAAFREQGFTGFDVRSVAARYKRRGDRRDPCDDNPGVETRVASQTEVPRLWELVVTGWGGAAPPESGVHLASTCDACGLLVYSGITDPQRLIDASQWDGSDFFMVWPLPLYIFVTDRVAEFIERRRFRGAQLRPLAELRRTTNGFGPGRLSLWMPDERARLLGEPLGIY